MKQKSVATTISPVSLYTEQSMMTTDFDHSSGEDVKRLEEKLSSADYSAIMRDMIESAFQTVAKTSAAGFVELLQKYGGPVALGLICLLILAVVVSGN